MLSWISLLPSMTSFHCSYWSASLQVLVVLPCDLLGMWSIAIQRLCRTLEDNGTITISTRFGIYKKGIWKISGKQNYDHKVWRFSRPIHIFTEPNWRIRRKKVDKNIWVMGHKWIIYWIRNVFTLIDLNLREAKNRFLGHGTMPRNKREWLN